MTAAAEGLEPCGEVVVDRHPLLSIEGVVKDVAQKGERTAKGLAIAQRGPAAGGELLCRRPGRRLDRPHRRGTPLLGADAPGGGEPLLPQPVQVGGDRAHVRITRPMGPGEQGRCPLGQSC